MNIWLGQGSWLLEHCYEISPWPYGLSIDAHSIFNLSINPTDVKKTYKLIKKFFFGNFNRWYLSENYRKSEGQYVSYITKLWGIAVWPLGEYNISIFLLIRRIYYFNNVFRFFQYNRKNIQEKVVTFPYICLEIFLLQIMSNVSFRDLIKIWIFYYAHK